MVTLRIGGYDVKRVLVNQGNGVEIMYPNLYKGLNLKPKDLTAYDSSLVSFDGKVVIPRGQIRLPVQQGQKWWRWTSLWWTLTLPTRPLCPDPSFMP